ncbi:hypothetical protein FGO68_gene11954 [Halteria grandinella]|uniref:Uncharacterized protein n=1 Tax=Halteria grandinella TaxID=5974 RepID=A0A8J8NR73_HALGN|nr:hypothetical protein FGO68_gene11954 [Halteria grandinella]
MKNTFNVFTKKIGLISVSGDVQQTIKSKLSWSSYRSIKVFEKFQYLKGFQRDHPQIIALKQIHNYAFSIIC